MFATSSGDTLVRPDDAWAVLDDGWAVEDASVMMRTTTAHLWDSTSPLKLGGVAAFLTGPADGIGQVHPVYSLVLAPRQRVVFMHVAAQRQGPTEALAFAREHGAGSAAL